MNIKKNGYRYQQKGDNFLIEVSKEQGSQWIPAYYISLDGQGLLQCSCPGFKYHHKQCKHVDAVVGILAKENIKPTKKTTADRIKKHGMRVEMIIAEQWMYQYARQVIGNKKASKLVNKMRKLLPKGDESTYDEFKVMRDMLEEKGDEYCKEIAKRRIEGGQT